MCFLSCKWMKKNWKRPENKQNFIDVLCTKLEDNNVRTLKASDDADLLIAQKVLEHLPFVHAIAWCDTTSRLFGIGKGVLLKKIKDDPEFGKQAEVFSKQSTKEEVKVAGENALLCLYGGGVKNTLDSLRMRKYRNMVIKSLSNVQIQKLPPTPDAAKFHSFHVYYQVQVWMGKGCFEFSVPQNTWYLEMVHVALNIKRDLIDTAGYCAVCIAQDIASVVSNCRKLTSKHIGLGLVLHQATRSESLVEMFHKANHTIGIDTNLHTGMDNLFNIGLECFALKTWCMIVKILGKSLHHGCSLINCMLEVVERGFKSQKPEVRISAFVAWRELIDNFACDPNILSSSKRLKLILEPLKINNARTDAVIQVKLDVWGHLMIMLNDHLANLFELVVVPSFHYCLGPIPEINESVNTSRPSLKTGISATFVRPDLVSKIGCKILASMLGNPEIKHDKLSSPSKFRKESSKCDLMPLNCEALSTPQFFLKHSSVFFLATKYSQKVLSSNASDSNTTLMIKIWSLLATHIVNISELPNSTEAVRRFFKIIEEIILSNNDKDEINLSILREIVLHLTQKLLTSPTYHVGSTNLMLGTPSSFLLAVMLKSNIVNVCNEEGLSYSRFLELYKKLISYTIQGNATSTLSFCQSVIQLLTDAVSSISRAESLLQLWVILVEILCGQINKSQEVNQGDSMSHDFTCIYHTLLFPAKFLFTKMFESSSSKLMHSTWNKLYKTFTYCASLVVNLSDNIWCEELCAKLLSLISDQSDFSLDTFYLINNLTKVIVSITDDIQMSAVNDVDTDNIKSKTSAKKNYLKPLKASKVLRNIKSLVGLISKVIFNEAESVKCLESTFQNKVSRVSRRVLDVIMAANEAVWCELIKVLSKLFRNIHNSDVLFKLLEELSFPISVLLAQPVKEKVDGLWSDVTQSLQLHYSGLYDDKMLELCTPLLKVTLCHSSSVIKKNTRLFWHSTFGQSASLNYPDDLKVVMEKVHPPLISDIQEVSEDSMMSSPLLSFKDVNNLRIPPQINPDRNKFGQNGSFLEKSPLKSPVKIAKSPSKTSLTALASKNSQKSPARRSILNTSIDDMDTQVYAPNEDAHDNEKDSFYEELNSTIKEHKKSRDQLIIMGDFNAKVGAGKEQQIIGPYGIGIRNENGEKLVDFCKQQKLIATNTWFEQKESSRHTWISPDGNTKNQLDYILLSERYRNSAKNSKARPGADCGSDHNPVVLKLKTTMKKLKSKQMGLHWNTEKLKEDKVRGEFREQIERKLGEVCTKEMSSEVLWNKFKKDIHEVAHQSCGRNNPEKKQPWITVEILNLMIERRKLKNPKNSKNNIRYKQMCRNIQKSCREAKETYYRDKCEELEELDAKHSPKLYVKIKELQQKKPRIKLGLRNKEGVVLQEDDDIKKRWHEYVKQLYSDRREEEYILKSRSTTMKGQCVYNAKWESDPQYKEWIGALKGDKKKALCKLCDRLILLSSMGESALKSHAKSEKHKNIIQSKQGITLSDFGFGSSATASTSGEVKKVTAMFTSETDLIVSPPLEDAAAAPKVPGSVKSFLIKDDVLRAEILWTLKAVTSHMSFSSSKNMSELLPKMFPDSEIAKQFQCGERKMAYVCVYGLAEFFKKLLNESIKGQFVVLFDESLNKKMQEKQMDVHVRYIDEANEVKTRYFGSTFLGHGTANDLMDHFTKSVLESGLPVKNMIQVSMDGPNVNWKFYGNLKKKLNDEYGTSLINIGSCGLHIVHNSFKRGMDATGWKVASFLSSLYYLFKDAPARKEDYVNVTSATLMPLKFVKHRWLENVPVCQRALDTWDSIVKFVKATQSGQLNKPNNKSYEIVKECVNDNNEKLIKIDVSDKNLQVNYKKIDIGYASEKLKNVKPSEREILEFRMECKACLVDLLKKLLEKCPATYSLVRHLSCLNPVNMASDKEVCSAKFKKVLMLLLSSGRISEKDCDPLLQEYGLFLDNIPVVVKLILVMSHGQASVERGFSINKEIEVENMKEHTLVARRMVCDHVNTVKGVTSVDINKSLLLSVKHSRKKYEQYLEQQRVNKKSDDLRAKRKSTLEEIEEIKKKKRRLDADIKCLNETADQLLQKAEDEGKLSHLTKANSFRRTAKDKMQQLDFVPIKTPPSTRKRILTKHQKEVLKNERFVPPMYNDLSQDNSELSSQFFSSDTQDADSQDMPSKTCLSNDLEKSINSTTCEKIKNPIRSVDPSECSSHSLKESENNLNNNSCVNVHTDEINSEKNPGAINSNTKVDDEMKPKSTMKSSEMDRSNIQSLSSQSLETIDKTTPKCHHSKDEAVKYPTSAVGVMIYPLKSDNGLIKKQVFRVPLHCVQDWKLKTKSAVSIARFALNEGLNEEASTPEIVEETPSEQIGQCDEFVPSSQNTEVAELVEPSSLPSNIHEVQTTLVPTNDDKIMPDTPTKRKVGRPRKDSSKLPTTPVKSKIFDTIEKASVSKINSSSESIISDVNSKNLMSIRSHSHRTRTMSVPSKILKDVKNYSRKSLESSTLQLNSENVLIDSDSRDITASSSDKTPVKPASDELSDCKAQVLSVKSRVDRRKTKTPVKFNGNKLFRDKKVNATEMKHNVKLKEISDDSESYNKTKNESESHLQATDSTDSSVTSSKSLKGVRGKTKQKFDDGTLQQSDHIETQTQPVNTKFKTANENIDSGTKLCADKPSNDSSLIDSEISQSKNRKVNDSQSDQSNNESESYKTESESDMQATNSIDSSAASSKSLKRKRGRPKQKRDHGTLQQSDRNEKQTQPVNTKFKTANENFDSGSKLCVDKPSNDSSLINSEISPSKNRKANDSQSDQSNNDGESYKTESESESYIQATNSTDSSVTTSESLKKKRGRPKQKSDDRKLQQSDRIETQTQPVNTKFKTADEILDSGSKLCVDKPSNDSRSDQSNNEW
ncbi:Telomere-associated protein RIF1 [Nymphon striatum]|nr:Telomere-associated protein RIF1 [Nymphon striatum]